MEEKEIEEILRLAKRLADYVRMYIETGIISADDAVGIAYRDFIKVWKDRHDGI